MIIDILVSIARFIGYFLANPLLYIGLIVIFFFSTRRVKKERQSFHTRVYGRMADIVVPLVPALVLGLIVSVITIGLGIIVSIPILLTIAAIYLLAVATFQLRWLTPTYVFGLLLLLLAVEPFLSSIDQLQPFYDVFASIPLVVLASLLATFLLAEGVLIRVNGSRYTSPSLERSKRGKWIGIHEARRLWIVPVVLFVPNGFIPIFEFWPVLTMGDVSLQPVLIPFLIGFKQFISSALPKKSIGKMGMRVIGLGVICALLAVGSYYLPVLAFVSAAFAMIARELLTLLSLRRDKKGFPFFQAQAKGCLVLGVLPGSPAWKMEIQVGEIITKVNGKRVYDENGFYEALQVNSAFAKLEVLTHEGEIRFAQGALYDGGHHELGVLLVKDEQTLQNSII